jgi:hypothetical protein
MTNNLCMSCKHRVHWSCDAFPNLIPEKIFNCEHDHHEPYEGDHGIQYEPIKTE